MLVAATAFDRHHFAVELVGRKQHRFTCARHDDGGTDEKHIGEQQFSGLIFIDQGFGHSGGQVDFPLGDEVEGLLPVLGRDPFELQPADL